MEIVNIFSRFISLSLEIPVIVLNDVKKDLYNFEKKHCFIAQLQPQLTEDLLGLFNKEMKERCIYEIHDLLGLRLLLLSFGGKGILIGPYVEEKWEESYRSELIAKLNLPSSYLIPYKLYYCGYRVFLTQIVTQLVNAAIESFEPEEPPYVQRTLFGMKEKEDVKLWEDEPIDFDMAMQRYEIENELMRMVQKGRPQAAFKVWSKMEHLSGALSFAQIDPKVMIASATILRTLVRKAAENAGVHPTIVDSISQNYAQKIYSTKSISELKKMMGDMIFEYSEIVRVTLQENYSPLVRKAADYIKLHLSQNIWLPELADTVGVSSNYLSRIFKKETGVSVSQYIAKKRCEKAAELLLNTDISVQDVSSHVGYLDNNYFVKVFKSQYELAPSEYRKKKTI